VADNFFDVFREIWVEDRGVAGLFFVGFSQGDALGDAATHRLGGVEYGHRTLTIFDDNLGAGAHASYQRRKSLAASVSEMWITFLAILSVTPFI
jgi:hypothetical protein